MQSIPGIFRLSSALFLTLSFFLLTLATSLPLQAQALDFAVNDRVQTNVNGLGWISGTVIEIGKGNQKGKVKVHADDYPDDFWVRASMKSAIRVNAAEKPDAAMAAAANAALDQAEATTPPRLGKYLIISRGAAATPLHLGYVELLADGNYKFLSMDGTETGKGQYAYDGAKSEVSWLSGPILASKWSGKFDITHAGKTHALKFNKSTVGENRAE